MIVPQDLTKLKPERLYQALDDLGSHRAVYGRGRTPEAAHVRAYCKDERARVKGELCRRGLRTTRPGDERVYGPGRAAWQRPLRHSDGDYEGRGRPTDEDCADLLDTERAALDVGVQ